ncbi:MAG: hypothetical protein IT515_16810 [Burkholderiales bacterium]|nr:hypothetical protein [Burkholderiales bacterium]
MNTPFHRPTFAPLALGFRAFRAGRIVTGLLYLLLLPLSAIAEPPEEKQLRSDLYILF